MHFHIHLVVLRLKSLRKISIKIRFLTDNKSDTYYRLILNRYLLLYPSGTNLKIACAYKGRKSENGLKFASTVWEIFSILAKDWLLFMQATTKFNPQANLLPVRLSIPWELRNMLPYPLFQLSKSKGEG